METGSRHRQTHGRTHGQVGIYDVVVVGGGVSGLAAAEAALRRAPGARVLCLEAADRPGGCIQTIQSGGFTMEAGPAGFLDKFGAVRKLADELGIADALISSNTQHRTRWVLRGGRLRVFPSSLTSFATGDLISARGKLRMLVEPLMGHADRDETVHAFAARRLGAEAAEYLINPIISGIYAADARQVSLRASLPHLAALERKKGSLLKAFLRASGKVQPLLSFRGGCGQLMDALRERLGEVLVCNARVSSIERAPHGFTLRVAGGHTGQESGPADRAQRAIETRTVVSCAPARAASRYVAALDPDIAFQLAQVRYASIVVISLGFRQADVTRPLDGYGYLVPTCEDTPVLGVQWSSAIYPNLRAPAGTCLLRLFVGGAHHPEVADAARMSESALLALGMDELRRTMGVTSEPVARHVERHVEAMPQYLLEHGSRVAEIERRTRAIPGLFIGGNGMRGLGMDALVHDADRQAQAALEFLASTPVPDVASPARASSRTSARTSARTSPVTAASDPRATADVSEIPDIAGIR